MDFNKHWKESILVYQLQLTLVQKTLKDPSSLEVNEAACCATKTNTYYFKFDYSAKNSLCGSNRTTVYMDANEKGEFEYGTFQLDPELQRIYEIAFTTLYEHNAIRLDVRKIQQALSK